MHAAENAASFVESRPHRYPTNAEASAQFRMTKRLFGMILSFVITVVVVSVVSMVSTQHVSNVIQYEIENPSWFKYLTLNAGHTEFPDTATRNPRLRASFTQVLDPCSAPRGSSRRRRVVSKVVDLRMTSLRKLCWNMLKWFDLRVDVCFLPYEVVFVYIMFFFSSIDFEERFLALLSGELAPWQLSQ